MESQDLTHRPDLEGKPGRARPLGLVVFGALVLTALLIAGILPRNRQKADLAASAQEVQSAPHVLFTTPHPGKQADLLLPADIQAIEQTTVNSRTSGYVRERFVDIGSRVKAGQLLAEIDSPEVEQQLLQARADTAKSEAGTGQAQSDVVRLQAGVAQAQADTEKMRANVEQAKAELARSQAQLAQMRAAFANSKAKLTSAQQILEGKKADLEQKKADFDIAEKTWKRWVELGKQGAVAQQEIDEKKSAYDSAVATVNSAQSAILSSQADAAAAQEAVNASQSDIAAAQAGVNSSRQGVQAALAALTSGQANVRAAQASVQASLQNVVAAKAQVGSSEANTRRYAVLQSFERVTAPFDGIITARNVDKGALVSGVAGVDTTGGPSSHSGLFSIARTDVLRIDVSVPQTFFSAIQPGQPTRILIREFPGRVFTGIIYRTAGALDTATRTLLTEIHIPNKNNLLLPGMYAQVAFYSAHVHPTLRIPGNTLVVDATGPHVVEVQDGKLHFVPVKLGRDYGTEVDVVAGLQGDEKLVTDPTDDLKDGEEVKADPAPIPAPEKK